MREIKFRAWDKVNNKFRDIESIIIGRNNKPTSIVSNGEFYQIQSNNQIELMQYTGFKIKEQEIYESDIIKARKNTIYKVVFERGCFFLYHLFLFDTDGNNLRWGLLSRLFDSDMIDVKKDCEIIGNIYENKDLLGVEK